jgi:Lrp/AsnC family transcriptional regulator, leucine-responsive regulatory protein
LHKSINLRYEDAMTPLSRSDTLILETLQQHGRINNQDLAEVAHLSPSACLRRVRALEEAGTIRQYVALLDPIKLDLGMLAFVSVKLEKRGSMPTDVFHAAVTLWPEVTACYSMTGEMDYLLRVVVRDLNHFSTFIMNSVLRQPGVVDVKSSFALERVKETTALPLPLRR